MNDKKYPSINQGVDDKLKKIKYWLSDAELSDIYTSDFWNNVDIEKNKSFWICDGNYSKCKRYLETSGLLEQ